MKAFGNLRADSPDSISIPCWAGLLTFADRHLPELEGSVNSKTRAKFKQHTLAGMLVEQQAPPTMMTTQRFVKRLRTCPTVT